MMRMLKLVLRYIHPDYRAKSHGEIEKYNDYLNIFFKKEKNLFNEYEDVSYSDAKITTIDNSHPIMSYFFKNPEKDFSKTVGVYRGNYFTGVPITYKFIIGIRKYTFQYGKDWISLVSAKVNNDLMKKSLEDLKDEAEMSYKVYQREERQAKSGDKTSSEAGADKPYASPSISRYQQESGKWLSQEIKEIMLERFKQH